MSEREPERARLKMWWADSRDENQGEVVRGFASLGDVQGMPREVARSTAMPWDPYPAHFMSVVYEADVIPHDGQGEKEQTDE